MLEYLVINFYSICIAAKKKRKTNIHSRMSLRCIVYLIILEYIVIRFNVSIYFFTSFLKTMSPFAVTIVFCFVIIFIIY